MYEALKKMMKTEYKTSTLGLKEREREERKKEKEGGGEREKEEKEVVQKERKSDTSSIDTTIFYPIQCESARQMKSFSSY